jgi:ABC-type oligopeptide transport system ATPase subunit
VLKANEDKYEKCIDLMQKLSSIMKTNTIKKVETLITHGLQEISGEKLKFVVQYETKRNAIQAQYKLYDEATKTYYDIINSFGGGIADIISILQRIIFIYQFDTAKILVLDEAGKWISNCMQNKFGKFLRDVSHQLGIQIILITHKDNMVEEADNVVRVTKVGDCSVIEQTKDEE